MPGSRASTHNRRSPFLTLLGVALPTRQEREQARREADHMRWMAKLTAPETEAAMGQYLKDHPDACEEEANAELWRIVGDGNAKPLWWGHG